MPRALIGGLLLSLLSVSAPALAEAPVASYTPPIVASVQETIVEPSEEELRAYALSKAQEYGISYHELSATIGCESEWNPKAIGDGGKSRGIAQIHAPSHPTITDEQAFNAYWAINWTAKKFKEGDAWMWTCARNLGFAGRSM